MGLPCHGGEVATKPYTICRVDAVAPRPPPSRVRQLASRKRGAGASRAYAHRALDRLHTHACLILKLSCRPSTGRRAAHPRLTRRRPTPHPVSSQPAQAPSSVDDTAMTPSAPPQPQPRAPPSQGGFSSNRAQRSGAATPGGDSLCTPHTVHLSLGPGAWAGASGSGGSGGGGGGGGNCGGGGGGGGSGGSSEVVVAGKDNRTRFLFREIRGFHELAFSIVILGGVEAEEDLARAVQSAAGAWVDARPDLEACGRALASGDEDSWRNFYILCMRDLPTYYDSLPADILREIRVRLRARYLSANVASYALHLLLAISLPNLAAHPVSSCSDVVDIVLGVLREPTSRDHARILIPALLFMCRIVSLEPACTEAVQSGVVQCMLANLQHTIDSKSLYRFLLVSFVLAKVSRQDAHVDAVLASKDPSFDALLSMLSNLPAPLGQQQDWTELAQVSLLTALQPCAARWTGVVSLHAFFSVWVLLCKHPKDTRLGKVSRAMCNELTKGCGVKVAAEHMTRRQWELLLSCEGGLLEIESVRRMARRAQDVVAARGEGDQWALTRDMVAQFGWRAAHGAKSDAVRAAALQCYGELLRCLTRVEVDCELVATLLPSLRSEAERLGDAVIEPCVFISTCLLTEGRYARAASMTVEVLEAIRCSHQYHLYDVPCAAAVTILGKVPAQPGVPGTAPPAYDTRQLHAEGLHNCTYELLMPLCVQLLRAYPLMIRASSRDDATQALALFHDKCGASLLASCISTAGVDLTVDRLLQARRPAIALPPFQFVDRVQGACVLSETHLRALLDDRTRQLECGNGTKAPALADRPLLDLHAIVKRGWELSQAQLQRHHQAGYPHGAGRPSHDLCNEVTYEM